MWFGQGHREPNPVPVSGRAKSPEDPKQMHRGSAPDPERSRRKLPGQQGQALEPSAQDRRGQVPLLPAPLPDSPGQIAGGRGTSRAQDARGAS